MYHPFTFCALHCQCMSCSEVGFSEQKHFCWNGNSFLQSLAQSAHSPGSKLPAKQKQNIVIFAAVHIAITTFNTLIANCMVCLYCAAPAVTSTFSSISVCPPHPLDPMWLYCTHQTQFTSPHSSWYLGLVKWIHHLYNAHIDQTEHTQLAFTVCINFSKKVVSSLITSLRSGVDSKLHLRWPWRDRAVSAWNQTPGLFYLLSAGAKAKPFTHT